LQAVPAFEDADATFATGAPLLQFLKPPLLLSFFALIAGFPVGGIETRFTPIFSAAAWLAAEKNPGSAGRACIASPNC